MRGKANMILESAVATLAPEGILTLKVRDGRAWISLTATVGADGFATINGEGLTSCDVADIEAHAVKMLGLLDQAKRFGNE